MYINLKNPNEKIEFGDIVTYSNETCLIANANSFRTEGFQVLVISLSRSKVLNAFSDLQSLNDSSCRLVAKEHSVEIILKGETK